MPRKLQAPHFFQKMTLDAMQPDTVILKEPPLWLILPLLVFHKVDLVLVLNLLPIMKPKPIWKLSQNLLKRWEEKPKELGTLLENISKKLVTLISTTVHLWKLTLNKLPGNAPLINNVNATVPYGLDLLKDSMIRSQLLNSTISDSLKLYLRIPVRVPGPPVTRPPSVPIHIQESQRPASARTGLYMLQTFVPMMVKIAYAPVS